MEPLHTMTQQTVTDLMQHVLPQANIACIAQVSGGLLHSMFRVDTDSGSFALKLLNSRIMARDTAMGNYAEAERLERILEKTDLPILPAKTLNGKKMQCLQGRYFYVFDWFEGSSLKEEEITTDHCRVIAKTLAKLHCIPLPEETGSRKANASRAICHNDLDSKNVLWSASGDLHSLRIIDLECLGIGSPALELFEQALAWSGLNACSPDYERLHVFLAAYGEGGGNLKADWSAVYQANTARKEWLLYNLERVQDPMLSKAEQSMAGEEVIKTAEQLVCYAKERERILQAFERAGSASGQ